MALGRVSMRQLVCSGLAAGVFLAGPAVHAEGRFTNVVITQVQVRSNGVAYLNTDTTKTTPGPNCSGSAQTWFTFSATSEAGKSLLNVVMSAYLSGKRVDMWGTNTCVAGYEGLHRLWFRTP